MKSTLICIFLTTFLQGSAQKNVDTALGHSFDVSDSIVITNSYNGKLPVRSYNSKGRVRLITGVHVGAYAGTMFLLGQAWYKNHPRTSFHTFNDSKEWLQADKGGHAWTAYNIAKYSKGLWSWAGVPHKKAVWLGGFSSIGYQTILEYLDAHSTEWGWSYSDMSANVFGSALYVSQELTWKEQRIQFKFSSQIIKYAPELEGRANDLFGQSVQEKILKDYNGHTYWLSMNLKSFVQDTRLPAWLNMAVGYGAKGLFGGFENIAYDHLGTMTFDRRDIKRVRQWYLSPDVDFTKFKSNKRGVKTLFSLLNMIKIPAPAVELSGGRLKGHLIYF